MSSRWRFAIALSAVLTPTRLPAQFAIQPSDRAFWIGAAASLVVAAASDVSAHRFSMEHRSHALDRWAEIGGGLGIGRHRPDEPGDAWRFKPFSAQGEWHSFPSAQHAFTIAAAAATETKSRWIVVTGFSAPTLVAWSRVYRLEHWPSDAVGAAVLGIVSAQTTLAWTHR